MSCMSNDLLPQFGDATFCCGHQSFRRLPELLDSSACNPQEMPERGQRREPLPYECPVEVAAIIKASPSTAWMLALEACCEVVSNRLETCLATHLAHSLCCPRRYVLDASTCAARRPAGVHPPQP